MAPTGDALTDTNGPPDARAAQLVQAWLAELAAHLHGPARARRAVVAELATACSKPSTPTTTAVCRPPGQPGRRCASSGNRPRSPPGSPPNWPPARPATPPSR